MFLRSARGDTRQKLGLLWKNRKKISQIIKVFPLNYFRLCSVEQRLRLQDKIISCLTLGLYLQVQRETHVLCRLEVFGWIEKDGNMRENQTATADDEGRHYGCVSSSNSTKPLSSLLILVPDPQGTREQLLP